MPGIQYVEYPEYYDYAHTQVEDVPFYLDYASKCGSPVLELACGTGRLVIPLARAGYRITGIDVSAGMLSICRQRVQAHGIENMVSLIESDMAEFDLPEKGFSLAFIALRSFSHLHRHEDQLKCLKEIYRHVRAGGLVIIASFALNHNVAVLTEATEFHALREFDLPDARHVTQMQRFVMHDPASQILHFEFKFHERKGEGGAVSEVTVPMVMRYTGRFELQLLLERTGFEMIDVFADYRKSPYGGKGEMIAVARKPG